MKKQFIAILILAVLVGCSKNDESLINHLETDSYLEDSQFSFLRQFENLDLRINESERISGTAYRQGKPFFIETSVDFSEVSTVTFPSVFQFAQLLYWNEDTVLLAKNTGDELNLYRSVNRSDFVLFYSKSVRDANNRELFTSDIFIKNATIGYFLMNTSSGTNPSTSILKLNGDQVSTIGAIKPGIGVPWYVFPNGKLLSTLIRPNGTNTVIYSESTDEGLTWNQDTIDWNTFRSISEIVNNDFVVNFVLGNLYTSTDGRSWRRIVSPDLNFIQDYQFFNQTDAYIMTEITSDIYGEICDLYKTTDSGVTWEKVNTKKFYGTKFHFYNKNLGIAYNKNAIQITRDGGVTWELIAFKEIGF